MRLPRAVSWSISTKIVCASAVAAAFTACDSEAPSTLDPAGPGADRVEGLWWFMLALAVVVTVVVTALLLVAVSKRRDGDRPWANERFVVLAGVVIPTVVLSLVFVVALRDMNALSAPGDETALTVEVNGKLWWWEVTYPDSGAVTANEVHIPAGEPVRLDLVADEVIHSFWVPRLQPKTDLIPGRTNTMWIEADEPGTYRGQCAEFCGLQHANMAFVVVAHTPEDFEEWLSAEAEPEDLDPALAAGREVFLESTCFGCHAVRGTEARSRIGPDLTHFGSRDYIAAGTLPNTTENLERWIVDPQGVKPGAIMPPTELSDEDLEALVAYLEGLE